DIAVSILLNLPPGNGLQSLDEWLERHESPGLVLDSEKTKEIAKTPVSLRQYIGKKGGEEYRVFVAEFELEPDVKVAFLGNGPGDKKKWRKYETSFTRMVRAFKRIPVSRAMDAGSKLGMGSIRAKKKAKLEAEMARAPGWELYETENYFVVTNNEDKAFIRELMERLEAIRKTYENLYPPTLAEEIRQEVAAEKAKARQASGEEEDEDEAPARPRRSSAGRADPMELSRASVVRVCKDQSQYYSYGGPRGSAGYWSSHHEELVIYDDKKGGGRGDTWITLNHEAFHQYIFYFFGNLAPHSWYNEGNGDFFSGYQLKNARFKLKKNSWREGTIKEAIRDGSYVPLKKLVKYTQREYYANPGLCYAQGWSFIWFLRTGEDKNAPGWNDDWNGILTQYLRTLAVTGDLEIAVDKAFEGVDWDEMEESWKAYIG
ncbi:MAG: hypothetical protein AAF368_04985, partial [Planctomycetota bacterium]